MSYHRILPPPPALTNQDRTGGWVPRRDSLLQNKIMAENSFKTIANKTRDKSLTSVQSNPSPTDNRDTSQPSDALVEEDIISSKARTRSSATLSNESSNPSDQPTTTRDSITEENTAWNTPSSICLCQPDPKVPRPRNAFILYRQHHQAHVVAQNPGLANPEISKEEKIRHQRQYPDYRYQPRRAGRNNSLTSSTSTPLDSENRRCAKCGGRSMNTSSALSSAGYLASASSASPSTPYSANRPPSTPSTGSSAMRFLQGAGSPPLTGSAKGFMHHGNRDPGNHITTLGLATPRYKRPEDADFSLSPDAKRRRVVGPPPYAAVQRFANGPPTPFAFPRRRESLPRPDFMNSPTFAMGPPPRPQPVAHPPDSSLTLPPLQNTSFSGDATQAKSVEAMVMSIPTLNKIRILSKISPPLANPSPASPGFETRGFIISIDGQELAAVEQITAYLNTVFTPSHAVKVFQSPIAAEAPQETEAEDEKRTESFETCHLKMAKYLTLSSQLKTYITSVPSASASAHSSPAVSPKSMPAKPSRTATPLGRIPNSTFAEPPSTDAKTSPRPATVVTSLIPIALVPAYQLTHADLSACRVPIDDNYAPTDHWQWMA
ncbi:MAG: hypothetical protein Q9179_006429, partial [Wetmoreana sp. 5 TL-2023]